MKLASVLRSTPGLLPLLFAGFALLALSTLLEGNSEHRLVYAVSSAALLYASKVVPVQFVGLPALALMPPMAEMEAAGDAWVSALRCLAAALFCRGTVEASSVVARVALLMLALSGTRVRRLAAALALTAAIAAPLLDATFGVFFMAAVCSHLVRLLRSKPLQDIQRRCLFRRATSTLSAKEQRSLARFIFREECALPMDDMPPPESPEGSDLVQEDAAPLSPPMAGPTVPEGPSPFDSPIVDGNRRPSRAIKLLLPPPSTRRGRGSGLRVVVPGESSPETVKRSLRRDSHAAFLEPIVFGDPALLGIVLWHSSRYTELEGYLLYRTLLVHSLVSMATLSGSPQNRFLVDYENRLQMHHRLSYQQWLCLVLPAAAASSTVLCYYVDGVLLDSFDAIEDTKASKLCHAAVTEAHRSIAIERYYEVFPLLCLGIWILRSTSFKTPEQKLLDDYSALVPLLACLSAPTQSRTASSRSPSMDRVVRSLPWGALLLIGCQLATEAAWSAFEPATSTASARLARALGGQHPIIIQTALTGASCVLTEFLGAHRTVALLLPAAAMLARERKCPWLYLAVPLTAASSVGVILPTASISMAVIHDSAHITPDITVVPGILVKVAATLALLLGTNALTSQVLGWEDRAAFLDEEHNTTAMVLTNAEDII